MAEQEEEIEVAEPVAKPKEKGPVKPRAKKIKIPTSIKTYWRAKDQNPHLFVHMPDGNLGTFVRETKKKGETVESLDEPPVKLFDLPYYVPITREEVDALWAERQSEFEVLYESIEKAKKALRDALAAYKAGAGSVRDVVVANQLVADEEAKLVEIRSPKRWIEILANPTTNEIDLTQKYETRKIGYDVNELKQYSIDPQKLLRPLTEAEAAAMMAAPKSGGGQVDTYGVVTDKNILGMHWPETIKIGNREYFTAFQAALAETAWEQGNTDLFQSLMGTRSSRTMRNLAKAKESQAELRPTPEILLKVAKAIPKTVPEFVDVLLNTNDDYLVYANIEDEYFSIGVSADDIQVQDSNAWRGENAWGEALMQARTEFREARVTNKVDGDIEKEEQVEHKVISKEEQDAKKTAAIINARRKAKRY